MGSASDRYNDVLHYDCCGAADAKTYHTVVSIDRGCPWELALKCRDAYIEDMRAEKRPPSAKSGFYVDRKKHGKHGGFPFPSIVSGVTSVCRDQRNPGGVLEALPFGRLLKSSVTSGTIQAVCSEASECDCFHSSQQAENDKEISSGRDWAYL